MSLLSASWRSYGIALLTILLAFLLTLATWQFIHEIPLIFFFVAILLSAWSGGLGPGLLTTALGIVVSALFLFSPRYALAVPSLADLARLGLFGLVGVLVSILNARRQRALEALQEHHQLLRAVIDGTTDAIWVKNRQGRYLLINPAGADFLGKSVEDVLGKDDTEFMSPETARHVMAHDRQVLAAGETRTYEEIATVAGHTRTYLSTKGVYRDQQGHILGLIGVSRDITARKQAEEALREREHRFRALIEQSSDSIAVIDADNNILYHSPAVATVEGYTAEELAGRNGLEHTHPDDVQLVHEIVRQLLAQPGKPIPVLWRRRHKDGHWIWLEGIATNLLHDPAVHGIVTNYRDVTERKRLEAALQQERDVLEVTLASIGDAVIATDPAAQLTFINPVAEALTGWTAQEAIGRNITEVFHIFNEQTRQVVENPVEKVLREGRIVGLANHTVLIARDGREAPIADSGAPIRGKSGQVHGAVLVFRDVTESKRAEAALVRAKEAAEAADRIKSEFLATMSHELRTPLNVILGYTAMLIEGAIGDLPPHQIDILRRIDRNSRVLFELISMVLDLNRLEAGRLPVDVQAVQVAPFLAEIKAEMQGLCDQSGLACVWRVAGGLPPLHTDPGKLKVVIKNLLSNAVKFTKEGGVTVTACQRGEGIEIGVTDTGIGIAPESQTFIFEPFRQLDGSATRSYSGSGLGLHIVRRLLEVLGGTVEVDSEVGRGSTFRVWIPKHRTGEGIDAHSALHLHATR